MTQTPNEKAKQLLDAYMRYVPAEESIELLFAKKCAIIAVDEIIYALDKSLMDADIEWYRQVKTEIEKF